MKEVINKIIKHSIILSNIKLSLFRIKWRKLNRHNFTTADNCFNCRYVKAGKGTYGALNIRHFGNPNERVVIGNFCSIGPDTVFVTGGEHRYDTVSVYPFDVKFGNNIEGSISKGPIVIDDDVWIGYGATIMSGVHIGQGAVIASGSVVTKDVSPYAIVGGVPAKVIKYRFEPEIIEELLKIDYSKLDVDTIKDHIDDLYIKLENIDQLGWLPIKYE